MNVDVTVVIGSKGGCGATSLCVAAASRLAQRVPTALVDGDLVGRRAPALLLDKVRALDAARTTPNLAAMTEGNFTIVELTASFDGGFTIKPPEVEELAASITERGTTVVVDAPQPFAAAVRAFVTRGRRFILVVEPTVLGVASARVMQYELARFGIPAERIDVVCVMRDQRAAMPASKIESLLGTRIALEIPHVTDRRYARAVDAFVALIEKPSAEGELVLKPSAQAPVGDRRLGARRPQPQPSNVVPLQPKTHEQTATRTTFFDAEQTRRDQLKAEIHEEVSRRIDPSKVSRSVDEASKLAELRAQVDGAVAEILASRSDVRSAEEAACLKVEIVDEVVGLGPIEDLLRQPDITEIMVNGPHRIYVERAGRIERTQKRFVDERQLRTIIERIIAPLGRRIDESQPMVDARLPDGSRVNAIIEPLAIDGATLTIRRFGTRRMTADDLIGIGAVAPELVDFLRACVEARLNILVAGGTGSGKTTFLNVLSSFLPEHERIVTIEDAAELSLAQSHVVRLEARPANIQGAGEIRIRDLVRNALRMRPDRIIVGECRGGEALDMLQAMNTGHDGSLTTIHANSPRDALSRVETMVLMAGYELPIRAIREQVSGALDLVIHLSRLRDGSRKVMSVCEVVGLEGDVVTTQEIARFEPRGLDKDGKVRGGFVFTGVQPLCLDRFASYGVSYDIRGLSELERVASW